MEIVLKLNKDPHSNRRKSRWDKKVGKATFTIYVQPWRVPKPEPPSILVRIESSSAHHQVPSLHPHDLIANASLALRPIVAQIARAEPKGKTVKYSPTIEDKNLWEIGEPYIPYDLLPSHDEQMLLLTIQWQ